MTVTEVLAGGERYRVTGHGLTAQGEFLEASALVLQDDNFATMVRAIEEGRGIYDNIRKFIRYLLSCNVGELLAVFLAMAVGLPLPLRPLQILWVNLVPDGLPAMALGVDSADKGVMWRQPRFPQEGVFSVVIIPAVIGVHLLAFPWHIVWKCPTFGGYLGGSVDRGGVPHRSDRSATFARALDCLILWVKTVYYLQESVCQSRGRSYRHESA